MFVLLVTGGKLFARMLDIYTNHWGRVGALAHGRVLVSAHLHTHNMAPVQHLCSAMSDNMHYVRFTAQLLNDYGGF